MSSIAEGAAAVCSLCGCALGEFANHYADPPVCRQDAGWTHILAASREPTPRIAHRPAHLHEVVDVIRHAWAIEFADAYAQHDIERMRLAIGQRSGVACKTSPRGIRSFTAFLEQDHLCAAARKMLSFVRYCDYERNSDVNGHCCRQP